MDMWSNKQKRPYMAVTGHWLEAKLVTTPFGPQYKLTLRTDLIGFLCVPGHHDGQHLATAFLHVIDRIRITHKVCLHAHISLSNIFVAWLGYSGQRTK